MSPHNNSPELITKTGKKNFCKMPTRDHPFNQSRRPLLSDCRPQPQMLQKPERKVYGFNDFNSIPRACVEYNVVNGYPYGDINDDDDDDDVDHNHHGDSYDDDNVGTQLSDSDFMFSDNNGNHSNQIYGNGVMAKDTGQYQQKIADFYATSNGKDVYDDDYSRRPLPPINKSTLQRHHQTLNANTDTNSGPFVFGVHSSGSFRTTTNNQHQDQLDKTVIAKPKYSSTTASFQNQSETSININGSFMRNRKSKSGRTKSKVPTTKCVVVGDGAVGKTNLIISYLENRFVPEHIPTASDIYNVEVEVDGAPVQVTLCDTAGQDTLDALRELSYPDSNVFLICFSVVNPSTFRSVKTKWAPKLMKCKGASILLVGTQADLRGDRNTLVKLQMQGETPISFRDAWDFARSIGAKYVETSSRTKDKVKEVFDTAIWEALLAQRRPSTTFWKKMLCFA